LDGSKHWLNNGLAELLPGMLFMIVELIGACSSHEVLSCFFILSVERAMFPSFQLISRGLMYVTVFFFLFLEKA
jgi:hypothetical protein